MHSDPPVLEQPSNNPAGMRRVRACFHIPADTFELIYGTECEQSLTRLCDYRVAPAALDWAEPGTLPDWLGDVEVLFTGWHSRRLDAELLARMPGLRAVFHGGGTIRPLVSDEFWKRGIRISTAASVNAIPVAEFASAIILLALKRAWVLGRDYAATRRFAAIHPEVPGACGSVVGLLSLGHIGRLVRERLRALEVKVVAYDPYLPPQAFARLDVEPVSLPELMRRSDVVSLHTPLNDQTRGLIGRELLAHMKRGSSLVNTSRGGVIDQGALVDFLRTRPDVQALLDVTDPMPARPDSPLFELPNVFLTPHIAGSLGPECRRMGRLMLAEFERYLCGQPLQHAVTREQAELQT